MHLSRDEVIRKFKGVMPGPVRKHGVEIGGVLHPIKEAFAQITEFDVLDFNTNYARDVFLRFGFEVKRQS